MSSGLTQYLFYVLLVAIPLTITAIGAMFSERSGVVNIALEGLMIVGAFVGVVFLRNAPLALQAKPILMYFCGMLIAGVAGTALSYLHALAAIKMKSNQVISATAINTMAPALAIFLMMTLSLGGVFGDDKIPINNTPFLIDRIPLLADIPIIGPIFFQNTYPSLYFGIVVLVASYVLLFKTRFGLRLRACGENPHAADAAGINIYRMRYVGVLISGLLAGWSGYFFVVTYSAQFNGTISGLGFLALAVLIFGNWKPFNIFFTALFFSALFTLSKGIAFFPTLEQALESVFSRLGISSNLLDLLPYLMTLIVLVLTSKRSMAPKASGQIYDKGER